MREKAKLLGLIQGKLMLAQAPLGNSNDVQAARLQQQQQGTLQPYK